MTSDFQPPPVLDLTACDKSTMSTTILVYANYRGHAWIHTGEIELTEHVGSSNRGYWTFGIQRRGVTDDEHDDYLVNNGRSATMSTSVTLVTIYQVVNDDVEGNPSPTGRFFEDDLTAFEESKPGTYTHAGRQPIEREAIKFPDGTIRLLGEVVITVHGTGEMALKAEREAAMKKLTRREREILGVKE